MKAIHKVNEEMECLSGVITPKFGIASFLLPIIGIGCSFIDDDSLSTLALSASIVSLGCSPVGNSSFP
ncbi:MAG: hypothetical protein IJR07_10210 [Bacteroidaceae bacterium]|nr:hypothetical protein [Bacteroidaceae bacterium]